MIEVVNRGQLFLKFCQRLIARFRPASISDQPAQGLNCRGAVRVGLRQLHETVGIFGHLGLFVLHDLLSFFGRFRLSVGFDKCLPSILEFLVKGGEFFSGIGLGLIGFRFLLFFIRPDTGRMAEQPHGEKRREAEN